MQRLNAYDKQIFNKHLFMIIITGLRHCLSYLTIEISNLLRERQKANN